MAKNGERTAARHARRFHVRQCAQRERQAACDACILRPTKKRESRRRIKKPAAESACDCKRKDELRKREQHIGEPHEKGVEPPAAIARDRADQTARAAHEEQQRQRRTERRLCAHEDARQEIAPVAVRPQKMLGARREKSPLQILCIRIMRRQERRTGGDDEHDAHGRRVWQQRAIPAHRHDAPAFS